MPKTRQQKEEIVQVLKEKLGKAKSVVFADYRGLTMKQLSDLRDKLRDLDAEFTITKNSLLSRAIPSLRSETSGSKTSTFHPFGLRPQDRRLLPSSLDGPTAALFAYDDEITPIKILVKALKDAALGKVKVGFMGEESLNEARILKLATLPTKDELRGQTVGVLVAPLQGIVSVLQGNLAKLVYALSEVQKQKGGV